MNTANFRVSSGMKKLIAGYLVIFVLLMGTIVGLQLVDQAGIGDTRRDASTSGIDLSLNPSATSVTPGQTFTVAVIADPKGQSMTAADITLQVDTTRFTIVSLTKGNMFDQASTPYGANTTTLLFDQATGQGSVDNTAGTARIAVGATCDRCYLGSTTPIPTPGVSPIAKCSPAPTPGCYPRTTSGQIALLTLQAKANAPSGAGTINFVAANSQTAALGSDTDVTVDRLPTTVSITTGALCNIDLVAPFGTINAADYGNFKTKYIAYLQTGTLDASIDFATPTGTINAADYGVFKTKYITYLQNTTCN